MATKAEKSKRERMFHIYLDALFMFLTQGAYTLGEDISSIGIKPVGDRILTRNKVTRVWNITGFPYNFDDELIRTLRNDMRERYPKVKLVFQILSEPIDLNVNHELFEKQMRSAGERYHKIANVFNSLSPTERAMGIKQRISAGMVLSFSEKDVADQREIWDSYLSVTNKVNSGGGLFYSYVFVHAQAPNNRVMNQFSNVFRKKLAGMKLVVKPIGSVINNYLENYGPATYISPEAKGYGQVFLPDSNLVHVLPTDTEGLVNTEGSLMGVNVKNGAPFFLEFFKSGQGQTVLFCAKTGWGKTHSAFEMILSLLGSSVHVSVVDLKGNEWNKLGIYTEYLEINLNGDNPRSVNTLRLDDMVVTKADCQEVYAMGVDGTVRVLSLMANIKPEEGNPDDLGILLEMAVTSYYNSKKVVATNPDTFVLTKDMKYEDILPFIGELESNVSLDEGVRRLCKLTRFRCDSYLKTGGRFSKAFENEITLGEVLDTPLVIYSLNKNSSQDLDTVETIKVFQAEFLSTKKHMFRKRMGEQSALVAEEVQRYQQSSKIVRFLSDTVTGSRSQNVMTILLLNDLNKLDSDDFSAIKGNISTAIVGKVIETDIHKLEFEYGFPKLASDLRILSANEEKYKHCFCAQFNTGYQIGNVMYRAFLPPSMNKALATRDIRE